jgi:gamma-glutamyltranspeptidase/glutathione hydrolase
MINVDSSHYPYASRRTATFAKNGMVASSQPLAAEVGLSMLKAGGNAVDAAVATAAALTVVEPTGCGIGGDAFAIVWMKDKLHGLNSSSFAPAGLTPEAMSEHGYGVGHSNTKMPLHGWLPVTVPGIPSAWATLHKRWGKLPFSEVLAPAIRLAREGFPVSPTISYLWAREARLMDKVLTNEVVKKSWFDTFSFDGRTPNPGELFLSSGHADSLQSIADTYAESFYRGELAEKIDAFARESGGLICKEDLARYQSEWVDPIKVNYRGYDIWEIPPSGQGLVVLMALNILKGYEFGKDGDRRDSTATIHKQIEAMKLAYTDGKAFISQPDCMPFSVEDLLTEDYAKSRRDLIGEKALEPSVGKPQKGGTVYLSTADSEGNMVSYIQSNFHGFGSGVVVPGTGIGLQNRGADFSLDPKHPNFLQAGKKPFHTIIPGFITKGDKAVGPFGVMGAYMQPQGQLQVISNMIDYGMNPQAALDAPRWQWFGDKTVGLEPELDPSIVKELQDKGHDATVATDPTIYGRGQIIIRDPETGVLCGGTEKRIDGAIAAY